MIGNLWHKLRLAFSSFGTLIQVVCLSLLFLAACQSQRQGANSAANGADNTSLRPDQVVGETIVSLEIRPKTIILRAGEHFRFKVVAKTATGKEYLDLWVDWQLDDIFVGAMDTQGSVTAKAQGRTTIKAFWQDITSSAAELFVLGDPLVAKQWHLKNIGQNGAFPGEDINIAELWLGGIKGQDILVNVVDDGVDIQHVDLVDNINYARSWNYATFSPDPSSGDHGTAVAGLIAAKDSNGIGGSGVAPRAQMAGINLLENYNLVNEANAMLINQDEVAVSNNSWGAVDGTGELSPAALSWEKAVQLGTETGRNGRGIVYVWAAGNGGRKDVDNSNYDGQANSPWVMAVCGVGDKGEHAPYSEKGANLWLCAPAGGGDSANALVTTDQSGDKGFNNRYTYWDLGDKDYTQYFTGTSAAAPLVSGVAAVMLGVNPTLTWRDVRMILARSARMNDASHPDWSFNQSAHRYPINHQYGFGVVNAKVAVEMAVTWSNMSPLQVFSSKIQWANLDIPDANDNGISHSLRIDPVDNLLIEYVQVEIDGANHGNFGDLQIELISPAQTRSILSQPHDCSDLPCTTRLENWRFGVSRFLEEQSQGDWILKVMDKKVGYTGKLHSWRLLIYGR